VIRRLVSVLAATLALATAAHAVVPGQQHAMDPKRTGLPYEEIVFPSASDSLKLSGWWFDGPARSPVVVFCPRGTGTMADLLPSVREMVQRGFTVMTFDYRDFGPGGPGETDSLRTLVFATRWVLDAQGAFAFARARAAGRRVFAWGQDLGGPVALAVGARDARLVDAIAVEGLFRTAIEQVEFNGTAPIPGVLPQHRLQVDTRDEPIATVPILHVPLLAIIAMKDDVTPPDVTKKLVTQSLSRIDRWIIPTAGHDGAELTPGYFDRLAGWFKGIAAQLPPATP
jgi:pimeloyl-ACP methyl ester carboxylesterase